MKKLSVFLTVVILTTFLTACTKTNVEPNDDSTLDKYESIKFNPDNYESKTLELDGEEIKVRAYEGIVYVTNPIELDRQILNIYVPEIYYDGTEINGFTIDTAPIFFPNKVGGYMPASPETLGGEENNDFMGGMGGNKPEGMNGDKPEGMKDLMRGGMGGGMGEKKASLSLYALKDGYIVASAGARGRTIATGKAPAGIVDLKAAIRYLKYNDELIPGDSNKVISNGTSAGGAMSALIGATGNNPDYDKYLEEIGAAPSTDDVFATSTYCPITNLDNANMAYEWQFYGANGTINVLDADSLDYQAEQNSTEKTLSEEELKHSKELKDAFPAYVNSLGLNGYQLNEDGEGTLKEAVKAQVIQTFDKALADGEDLSSYDWLTIEDNHVIDLDFDEYIKNYMVRNKNIPAFDGFDLSAGENQLFGTEKIDSRHFTQYAYENSTVNGELAPEELVKVMNPMYYIGDENTDVSHYWRIRHGSKDEHTSLSISFLLAKSLEQKENAEVDFWYPYNQGHGGDYDIEEFMAWMNGITH